MIAPPHGRVAACLALLLAAGDALAAAPGCLPAGRALAADGAGDAGPGPLASEAGSEQHGATPPAAQEPGQATPGLAGALALPGGSAIQWSADRWSTHSATGDTRLEGDVQLGFGDRELHADRLDYRAEGQQLQLSGHVGYTDPQLHVAGETGRYGPGLAEFTDAQFELRAQHGRGTASRIALGDPRHVQLEQVTYTTCEPGHADWQLHARRISLDLGRMRGVGRDTRVDFKGVPILYLPVLSFPLSDARQSGFLFPMLGSSSSGGATLAVPWYWNIAPNQDLTLTPKVYTRRGVELGTEYRLLEPASRATLAVNYLPSDQVRYVRPDGSSERRDRHHELLEAASRLDEPWHARLHVESVSDSSYFENFSDGALTASTVFVPSELAASLRNDHVRVQLQALQYQTIDDQLATVQRPYAQRPRVSAEGLWHPFDGLAIGYSAELANFLREADATPGVTDGGGNVRGWRGNVRPSVAFDYTRPAYYFRPGVALDLTAYRLQDPGLDALGQPRPGSVQRSLPIVTLDSGLQLERADARRLVTLEPRLYYVYIPYRDQSQLPNFDSGLPDPNLVSLFSANRYTGLDRIGEANQLTLGLTGRLLHPGSGRQLVAAMIGETLHADSACTTPVSGSAPRCVLLQAGDAPDTRRRSDLLVAVDVTAFNHWNLRYDLAWNPGSSRTEKAVLALQYRPSGDRVLNLGYRYARPTGVSATTSTPGTTQLLANGVDQAEFSLAWPVASHWDVYARGAYAFGCSATYEGGQAGTAPATACGTSAAGNVLVAVHRLETFAGFQYRGSCWGLRVVARDAVSRTAGERDRGWYLQLELNGLSSVGSGAEAFLRGSIRGYSPASPGR